MPEPTIQLFLFPGPSATSRACTVATLAPGWKVLCGGAQVVLSEPSGQNNMLTASYPMAQNQWTALSKDQDIESPATINVYIFALHDPDDNYDVQIVSSTTTIPTFWPTATATLLPGYVLVGGGAQANFGSAGQFLVASAPTPDMKSWTARSQDHIYSDPGTVTAYAIGIRPRAGAMSIQTLLASQTSLTPQSAADEDLPATSPSRLIGGGAAVVATGSYGNLLTGSYPRTEQEWHAVSHDHLKPDPANITVFAIGALFS